MRIAVLMKPILNALNINAIDQEVLSKANLKLNEADKSALELALKLKEQLGGEVIAITALTWFCNEDKRIKEVIKLLREALAIGADRAIIVKGTNLCTGNHVITAKALIKAIKKSGPYDLILCGEGSSDIFSQVIPVIVASKLNIPFIGLVKNIEISSNKIIANIKLDNVEMSIEVELPVVASIMKDIVTPRLPTLIGLKRAYEKPVDVIEFSEEDTFTKSVEMVNLKVITRVRKQIIRAHMPSDKLANEFVNILKELHVVKIQ